MFTGLVEARGTITALENAADGMRLTVAAPFAGSVGDGDSVAVDGCCLTVTSHDTDTMSFAAMHETLRRTTLAGRRRGDGVNLERALRAGDRLGGHIVSGHVDGVGRITAVDGDGFARIVRIEPPAGLLAHIVEKGSVCLDGVSLTVATVDDTGLTVSLIPETLARTTFGDAVEGRCVNIETDIMAKHVEKLVAAALAARTAADREEPR